MHEAQGVGVQRLPGHELKGILHESPIRTRALAHPNPVAAVGGIRKERVADVLHMRPNLMGATGFEYATDQRNRAEAL